MTDHWEYCVISHYVLDHGRKEHRFFASDGFYVEHCEAMNEMAEEGWEVFCVIPKGADKGTDLLLRRRPPGSAAPNHRLGRRTNVQSSSQADDSTISPSIFIAHGHSGAWREVKDHLTEQHGYTVEAYETGARAGHTVRDILSTALDNAAFAIVLLTREDETATGEFRPRQNAVHELGLFQGRLGSSRAVAVVEDGVEVLSNLDGVHQIRFQRSVRETFGDILATLTREFGPPVR